MALHAVSEQEGPEARFVRYLYPVIETVSASGTGAAMITDVIAGMRMNVAVFDWTSNATSNVFHGGLYYAGASEYDADFVASILKADAEPAEARFNNVVDMLDWLNRD